jgi:hypothetical protein
MEKIISGARVGRLLLILFAFVCMMLISVQAFSAGQPIARLTEFSGTVLIKSQGSWGVEPEEGLPLYSDDKLVTKIGIATVTFNDGAVIEINPNSNLLIEESEEEEGIGEKISGLKRRLRLLLGKMVFKTSRSSTIKTSLVTSTMVCGLRGTEGILSIGADGETYLQFTEGGGEVIGDFISGVAADVPTELANLNPVQRAAFVAVAAAEQAKQASEKLAAGEITDADAALAAAQAAEAAAQEAKVAAEAMLTNPDLEIQSEAAATIEAADAAIKAAQEAQEQAVEEGATPGAAPTGEAEEIGFEVEEETEVTDYSKGDLLEENDRRVADMNAPEVLLSNKPATITNTSSALFEFSVEDDISKTSEVLVSYKLDGGELVALEPPSAETLAELGGEPYVYCADFSGLSEDLHQFIITATDEENNITTSSYIWTTDYTVPVALFSSTPEDIDNISSFGLDAEDTNKSAGITYEYSLDGGSTWTPASASLDLGLATDGSADGEYAIKVKATDAAGNTGSVVSYSWIYDATPPVIEVAGQPDALTTSTEVALCVEYTNTEPGEVTYGYTLDGSDVDSVSLTGLADGSHSLVVTATDQAGNSSTSTVAWEVDTTPPGNLAVSKSNTAETLDFTLSSEDAHEVSYTWSLKDGTGAEVESGEGQSVSIELATLEDGNYTFAWEATDELGNSTSASGDAQVGFTFDTYALAGEVSGTGSIITGTAEGQASIAGGEDWGSKSLATDMTGAWSGEHSGTVSLASGGKATGSTEEGLWLSTITGSITGTEATGTSEFTMLTPTTLLEGAGTFSGTFPEDNTWTGSEEASDLTYGNLTFSSNFTGTESGGLYRLFDGTFYKGEVVKYDYYDYYYKYLGEYEGGYFLADSYFDFSGDTPVVSDTGTILFGFRELDLEQDGGGYDYIEERFTPYGVQPGKGVYILMGDEGGSWEKWDLGSLYPSFFTDPADLGIDLTSPGWELRHYREEEANILAQSGEFSGIMGGTGDLWSGADITLLGNYKPWDGDYSKSSIFGAKIASSEITGGGSYAGFLLGSFDSAVTGALYALYVKDDGSGGILSSDFSGTTYPDIAMWDGEGPVTATQLADGTGIEPSALEASLDKGRVGGWLGGDFGTSGSLIKSEEGWGQTLSVSENSDWGVFTMLFGGANYYNNPESSESWTARAGGMFFSPNDYGYWMTDEMSGTASSGDLSADMTGKVLTLTQYADVAGNVMGTYDTSAEGDSWQATLGGYWENGQDLYFNGEIWGPLGLTTKEYGGYGFSETQDFYYTYEELTGMAWSTFYYGETGKYFYTTYYPDGTYEYYTVLGDTVSDRVTERWDTEADDLLDYLENRVANYEEYNNYSHYSLFHLGWINSNIGGLESLWDATVEAPADIVMLGEFDVDDDGEYAIPLIFNTEIESIDPYTYEDTMWSEALGSTIGAYYGYGAGITLPGSISLQGDVLALYLDDGGNAGYLRGSFDGDAYENGRVWEATGAVYPEQVESPGIVPADFDIVYGSGWGAISGQLGETGTLNSFTSGAAMYDYGYPSMDLRTASIIDYTTSNIALDWGIYSGALCGDFENPESASNWTSKIGGETDLGAYFYETGGWSMDHGYFIADTASTWADGILSADLSGRFLTYTRMGDPALDQDTGIAGEILGTYNSDTGTWQAVNLGTWRGTDLAFVNDFSSSINHAVSSYNGRYDYSEGGYYYYSYYGDNSWGYSANYPTSSLYPRTYTYYNSDGTTTTYSYDADGNYLGITGEGTWDPETQLLSQIVTSPTPPEGEDYELDYEDEYLSSNYSGYMEGLMGGTDSLWSGTGVDISFTLMGQYYDYGDGSIWSNYLTSYNYKNDTDTTYDDPAGAYYGYMGGIKKNNDLEGLLAAIYIAPDGSAGYLTGDVAGDVNPGIEMFEMNGTINRTEMVSAGGIGIAPQDLSYSIWEDYAYLDLFGSFSGSGNISTGDEYNYFDLYSISGKTWGIFGGDYYGTFENPAEQTTWNSRIGGHAYFPVDVGYYGYLLAETASIWENNVLEASLNGRFLTETLMGDISGDVLGTYTGTTDGLWEAVSLGTWSGTDLAYASDSNEMYYYISHAMNWYYGNYNYTGDAYSYYDYEYYDEGVYGYLAYVRFYSDDGAGGLPNYYIEYYDDGSYSGHDYDTGEDISGNWMDEGLDLKTIKNPPDEYSGDYEEYHYVDTFLNNYDYMYGFMGGTASLWSGSDIPVTLMGPYVREGIDHGIWYDTVSSYNYKDYTDTTYDGGAYYGRTLGIAYSEGSTDTLEGGFTAIYIDPNGKAGYLIGSITGSGYTDMEMFEMDGSINRVEMTNTGAITADQLTSNIHSSYLSLSGSGSFTGGGEISSLDPDYYSSSIQDESWGIWYDSYQFGTYSGTTSDDWFMYLNDDYGYQWLGIDGTQWSGGKIAGDVAGAWVDLEMAQTGVIGGDLMGTFDPDYTTWEAVSAGAWIETSTFLDMVQNNQAGLEALNIPCIEVGSTTLTGSDTDETLFVTMNNVEFFAYSTGAAPKIWATGDVSGTTWDDPVGVGAISLTGTGFDSGVAFKVNNYNNVVDGAWDASVSGSGTVEGHDITIEGGAAGSVTTPYISDMVQQGEFSGTGAGVARP